MIIIRLVGGLGNQLFQLAAATQLQKKVHQPIAFYTDHLSLYATKRSFKLAFLYKYETDIVFASPKWLTRLILRYRINKLLPFFFPFIISSKNINSAKASKNYVLDDYFQDISQIKEGVTDIALKIGNVANNDYYNNLFQPIFQNINSKIFALHIRRGDYLKDNNKNIYCYLTNTYYNNAINILQETDYTACVFSDETVDSALLNKPNYNVINISNYNFTDVEEFLLLSKFKNIIIANSTFSFWAAISCNNVVKKVIIAPLFWLHNTTENSIWQANMSLHKINAINNNL